MTQEAKTKQKPAKTLEYTSTFGNKFTFQRVLPSEMVKISKKIREDEFAYMDLMLEHCVVVPSGLKIDDFETEENLCGWGELVEVTREALRFLSAK